MATSNPTDPFDLAPLDLPPAEGSFQTAWRIMTGDPVAFAAIVILTIAAVAVLIGPEALGLPHPDAQSLSDRLTPPRWEEGGRTAYLLGTDHLGRDMLSRLIAGMRVTFVVAGLATALGCAVGSLLGLLSGFLGGWVDSVISGLVNIQLSFPAILMAMLLVTVMRPSETTLVLALGLNGWMLYARLIRGLVLTLREATFVEASTSLGNSRWGILWRHILPNAVPGIISAAILELARMALGEASLSFLGFGIQPPTVSLGVMLAQGRELLIRSWWMAGFPGLTIAVLVLLLNVVGNRLRDVLDPNQSA